MKGVNDYIVYTCADLAGGDEIKPDHLAEAIHFRSLYVDGWVDY